MLVLFGLGNIGKKYQKSRHNVGFWVLDKVAQELKAEKWCNKKYYQYCKAEREGIPIMLVKPTTFVNSSGQAVKELISQNNIPFSDLWVIYDDINVPIGSFRVRQTGGSGGHNGIKSIIENTGSGEFPRIRVGIGPKPDDQSQVTEPESGDLADFVLSKFTKTEQKKIDKVVDALAEYVIASIGQEELTEETIHL